MEEKSSLVDSILERAILYVKTTFDLYKLKAVEKSADLLSTFFSRIIILFFVSIIIILLNIGLALWIGDLTGKSYYGFFIVALFYLVVTLLLLLFQEQLVKLPICNSIITHMLKEKNNDEKKAKE